MITPFPAKNMCLGEDTVLRGHLLSIIRNRRIIPYFQPIVDIGSGEIHGYEILSRAEPPFDDPLFMFEKAGNFDLAWEVEYACRSAALNAVSGLSEKLKCRKFFLNISPRIFSDSRFISGTTMETLGKLGLNPGNIVIEITESASVEDYSRFEKLIQHYVKQGFNVALDDFGAGHSGLITLMAMTPHYLKFDRALISDININTYKQKLAKSIVNFGDNVNISLVAEGIETFEELRTVSRLGVRYGQGFFLGMPSPEPEELSREVLNVIDELAEARRRIKFSFDMSISGMVSKPLTMNADSVDCGEMDSAFKREAKLSHVVITEGGKPVSILTRQHFYSVISGRYGFSVFQKKYIDSIAKREILCVSEDVDLRNLSHAAMGRKMDDLYDPVVVVDCNGDLAGTITMRQVINRAFDLEIKIAACANPLTQLPGNIVIGYWLEEVLGRESFSILYFDLDHFKEYNDTYGFARGDDLLKGIARMLSDFADKIPNARLGHIGGDDFIIISDNVVDEILLEWLCVHFDETAGKYFSAEHAEKGRFSALNRQGESVMLPLTRLSIAVLTEKNFTGVPHPGRIGQVAAFLKKQVKAMNQTSGKSGYLYDRREHYPENT